MALRLPGVRAVAPLVLALGGAVVACGGGAASDDGASTGDAFSTVPAGGYKAYADLAAAGGAAPKAHEVTVVGLRGLSYAGVAHPTRYGHAYDDTLVVLAADGVTAQRFAASTHPFDNDAPGVPDVNRDGVADVGMIRPGVYDVVPRDRLVGGEPSFSVTQHGDGALPGWRDVNHDGVLSDGERAASERRQDEITDVLFHQGEGTAPPAVGCQVLSATEIGPFVTAVGGPKARFRYVLVDMTGRDVSKLPR